MNAKKYRTLCMSDEVVESALDPLRELGEVDVKAPDRQFLLDHIHEYDAYLPALKVRIDRELARRGAAGRLRLIYTPSTGLDHLDLDALEEFGVQMECIRTEFELLDRITSTAELAFTLMLSAARKVPAGHNAAMKGVWARDLYRGHQLSGKTLGVLGVGRLGSMMVDFGRGFRMNVIGCDPNPRKRIPDLEYLGFEEFAARADVITIHIHLTAENERFLNAERIEQMKDGVILVNTSRGKIIDEEALLAALRAGKVGGFGADVIVGEWRDDLDRHPLIAYAREHDNVTIVPHVGGVTWEAQSMTLRFVAEKMAAVMRAW
jgi:D-3-phosphoglycerate dehydrogenase